MHATSHLQGVARQTRHQGRSEISAAPQASAEFGAAQRCKSSPLHQNGCGLRLAQQHPNSPRLLAAAIVSGLP